MTPYQKRTLSPLAQRMAGDMYMHNLSQRTIDAYTYHVERFARFFDKSLDQLGPEEVRQLLACVPPTQTSHGSVDLVRGGTAAG